MQIKKYRIRKFAAVGFCAALMCQPLGLTAYADMNSAAVGTVSGTAVAVSGGELTAAAGTSDAAVSVGAVAVEETAAQISSTMETAAVGGTAAGQSSAVVTSGTQTSSVGPSVNGSSQTSRSNVVIAGSSAASGILSTMGETGQTLSPMLGGAVLTMLNSQSESQILSCLIQTQNGSLIVVDGGLGEDADYLTSQITARGGHVAAWLITHPHGDHVGALYRILQNEDARYAAGQPAQVTIDKIYYNFADLSWYQANDPDEYTMEASIIGTLSGRPASMLQVVNRGETYQVDNAVIQIMNSRYEVSSDKGNNSGIVYKVIVNGKSILFTGDMSQEGGNRLLAEVGAAALKSDIVQMAHHGQNGVSEEFYRAVSPSVCLWPTPRWLWVSMESKYLIQTTKNWMKNLGVQYHYVMKDGDQVIY